ncbi:MAG TPA: SLBB domain-containing protein, partial [Bacillota bacterium]|nr:SLBB domain-containing protein [Bacillota bacterium]
VLSCTDACLIKERPHDAVNGIKIMMKILKVKHADIFIGEDMYREAYELLDFIKNRTLIDVRLMKSKYPQGDERQLLAAAYRIELPYDKLPLDSEAVVFNISTCVAVYDALLHGMPMTHKFITVSGDAVREPHILKVPIGLPFADVLNACGGVAENSHIIDGGLMMGREADLKDAYVTKQTTAVCAVSSVPEYDGTQCVRCGRCENACPMRLPVSRIYELSSVGDVRACASLGVLQCVGCGCCSYVCVGALPLVRVMQDTKVKAYSLISEREETESK